MMNEQDRNEAAAIDARIARALRMLYARETRWREDPGTSLRVAEVCAALETAPREEAPASLSASEALFGFVGWITTRRERMVASATDDAAPWPALIEKFCECNALPMPREGWNRNLVHPREEAPDPLSPEAFRGRTTPNGLPVRWVAWDQEGVPFEYSTAAEPHRNAWGALHNNISSLNSRFDLLDPARAGQTLWVGEGPDPRTVQAPTRFTDNGDGTITDHKTGLMWEKETRGKMPWQEAMDSCAALTLAGHTDWRLPCIKELQSIVDFGRSFPACEPALNARSDSYWSSTTLKAHPIHAWLVRFNYGDTSSTVKTYNFFVRAVRAGSTIERLDDSTIPAPNASAVPCASPSTLPPLVGPDRPCLTWQDSAEHGSEWERIARAERAAREADIARLERERDNIIMQRDHWRRECSDIQERDLRALRERAETAEREREEARATAAQLTRELAASLDAQAAATVERNSLRREREACLTALGVKP